MQTGPAIRESLVSLLTAVWFILIYGTSSLILLASADRWLALPVLLWFAGYIVMLRVFVPRMQNKSKVMSEARSMLTGRIVDTYTNIVTVKLFARAKEEDGYVREAIDYHTDRFHESLRLNTLFALTLTILNSLLIVATGAFAIVLWRHGYVGVGVVAMALPMTMQIISASGWVAWQVTDIFENIGVVQEGMLTIARPHTLVDQPDARTLKVSRGEIRFENIRFGYGRETGLIDGLTLDVRPGEKIGLVGRSGAGKSTLVNLLLRFFDLEGGRILIDGQDISGVSQESLRAHISMVTQDTSLLHRSIRDNIRYGRPDAGEAEIVAAAQMAHAHGGPNVANYEPRSLTAQTIVTVCPLESCVAVPRLVSKRKTDPANAPRPASPPRTPRGVASRCPTSAVRSWRAAARRETTSRRDSREIGPKAGRRPKPSHTRGPRRPASAAPGNSARSRLCLPAPSA